MAWNAYRRFAELTAGPPLDVGEVLAVHTDGVIVETPSGAQIKVLGEGTIGDHVYFRGGVIEGPAPSLAGIDQYI